MENKHLLIGAGGALLLLVAVASVTNNGGGPSGVGDGNGFGTAGGDGGSVGSGVAASGTAGGRYTLVDENGFGQQMPAATVEIPAGWSARGSFRWNGATPCDVENPARYLRLTSADGSRQIEYFPGLIVGNMLNIPPSARCIQAQVNGIEQMLTQILIPNVVQGWTLQSVNQAQVPPQIQQQAQQFQGANTYAFDVILASPDGAQSGLLQIAGMSTQVNTAGTGIPTPVFHMITSIRLMRGPRDALPQLVQMADQVYASTQLNPQWSQRVHEHRMRMINGGRPGPGGSSGGGGSSSGGSSGSGGENFPGERSGERRQRETIDGIREMQRCRDPNTGEIYEVSIHAGPCPQ